jgi:uncharacterized RDD family membrane protein YckC
MSVADDLSRYRTFWERFVASLLDGMLLIPVTIPTTILAGYGPVPLAVAFCILTTPLGFVYTSYCHGRWGQTIGKRAAAIVVRRSEDDGPIGYRRAIRRDAPTILFAALGTAILVFLIVSDHRDSFRMFDGYGDAFKTAQADRGEQQEPELTNPLTEIGGWQWALILVQWSWFLAEVGTMLTNERRRALHDLIGGTVVVKAEYLEQSNASASHASAS